MLFLRDEDIIGSSYKHYPYIIVIGSFVINVLFIGY